MFHVLPHLAIEGAPGQWVWTMEILLDRGLSEDEAFKQIAFAYSGDPFGALPEELHDDRSEQRACSSPSPSW
jgi:hypothetical protein